MKTKLFILIALLASLVLFVACGGDDEEENGTGTPGTFKGYVVDFAGDTRLPDVTIYALNNETGEKLEGVESQVSDANGEFTFTGIPEDIELLGFLCEGFGDETTGAVDTYQFNLVANATNEKLWSVDRVTYSTAPLAAGVTLDEELGVVAGAVYWVNADEEEEIVGCSTVTVEPASDAVRYFNDSRLPVNTSSRDSVNPTNGYYLIANMDIGSTTTTAWVDGEAVGTTTFVSVPNSICISNIYAETDANPSPADCE